MGPDAAVPRPAEGHVDAARLVLDQGAEVDRAEEDGRTPLHIACHQGHLDAAQLLLERGAKKVDQADPLDYGRTLLYMACENNHVDAARILLDKGAEVDRADMHDRTPLYIACEKGHVNAARLLINNGAEVDRAMKDGWTPLFAACENATSARALLDGADVNRANKKGETPLFIACALTRLLLDNVDAANGLVIACAEVGQSTRRGCCWTKAQRWTGWTRTVERRCTPACETQRRHGAAVAGQRRGCRSARRTVGHRCTARARWRRQRLPSCCWTRGAEVDRANEKGPTA